MDEQTPQQIFKNSTLVQKINLIDDILETKIREFLHSDGGDMDLINVVEKNGQILVYVEFQGACTSCDSSGGTHQSIETILRRMLSPEIKVLTI